MRTSKKMILSVLVLVMAIIALGTTTFAWFSLSTISQISQITGQVRGGEGLEIRLYHSESAKTDWKANLSERDWDEFVEAMIENYEDVFRLNAVSTIDGRSFYKADTINQNYVLNGKNAVKNEDYLEFKIQLKSKTEGTINLESYEFEGAGQQFVPTVNYLQYEGHEGVLPVVVDPSNGARFSLETNNALQTYQKPAVAYSGNPIAGNSTVNYPVEYGQYSFLTESKNMELYYIDNSQQKKVTLNGDGLNEIKLSDIQMNSAYENVELSEEEFRTSVDLIQGVSFVDSNEHGLEFTIRIWIEGWDADTYDVLYRGTLSLTLEFVKESEED